MFKINSNEMIREESIECILSYDVKCLKNIGKKMKENGNCRIFRGRNGTKSFIMLNIGYAILAPFKPDTYFERCNKDDFIMLSSKFYLRKNEIREITTSPNTQQREEIKQAKLNNTYFNLSGKKVTRYYIFTISGRIYGFNNVKANCFTEMA